MVEQLKFGTNKDGKPEASFVIIMTESIKPWEFHHLKISKEMDCPAFIIITRWDGRKGFPGGFVESNESLEQAATRELFEETGIKVLDSELEPVNTLSDNVTVHLFKHVVDEEVFLRMLEQSWIHSTVVLRDIINRKFTKEPLVFDSLRNVNFFTEVLSVQPVYVSDLGAGKGFPNFLKYPFPPLMLHQLALFLQEQEWFKEKKIIQWFNDAGLDYRHLVFHK